MPRVRDFLLNARSYLQERGIEEPRLDAELLLAHLLGVDRLEFLSHPERPLDRETEAAYLSLIERRAQGEPISHILGYREFYGRRFRVTPDVLTPRPETEGLVDLALETSIAPGSRVLDLCAGSGCIGLSLLLERPDLLLDLADLSAPALEVARANARDLLNDAQASESGSSRPPEFFLGDLYEPLPPDRRYELILGNPPYIHPDEAPSLAREVREFDPAIALYREDPPAFYETIASGARERLTSGGRLLLELGPLYAKDILKKARTYFPGAEIRLDLAGRERYLVCVAPP